MFIYLFLQQGRQKFGKPSADVQKVLISFIGLRKNSFGDQIPLMTGSHGGLNSELHATFQHLGKNRPLLDSYKKVNKNLTLQSS